MQLSWLVLLPVVVALAGCGREFTLADEELDAGPADVGPTDAGLDAAPDAGTDGGEGDAGIDAGDAPDAEPPGEVCYHDSDCEEPTPYCLFPGWRCGECRAPPTFACPDRERPFCDTLSYSCTAGLGCDGGDDPIEDADDGPSGATVVPIPPAGSPATVVGGTICNRPGEYDFFELTAATDTNVLVTLDYPEVFVGGRTLQVNLSVYGAIGLPTGVGAIAAGALPGVPARALFRVPAGTSYFLSVETPDAWASPVRYALSVSVPECADDFDCVDPARPHCGGLACDFEEIPCEVARCAAGPARCIGDDALREGGDDGPAGATDATPPSGGMVEIDSAICSAPLAPREMDWFRVTVDDGDNLELALSFSPDSGSVLSLHVLQRPVASTSAEETWAMLGLGLYRNPQQVTMTYLPAGTYYAYVIRSDVDADGDDVAIADAIPYTLSIARTPGACADVADCAREYQTQAFRGRCLPSGACDFIDGGRALALGELCDSDDDCAATCGHAPFQENAVERSICTHACGGFGDDASCAALGPGFVCSGGTICPPTCFDFVCLPACEGDLTCGAFVGYEPEEPSTLPWSYQRCLPTGACCGLPCD